MRVLQLVPAMHVGGVERGVLEIDSALTEASASSLVASSGGPLVSQLKGAHLQCGLLARRDPFCVLLFNPLRLAFWLRRHRIDVVHARSRCLVVSALIACAVTPRSAVCHHPISLVCSPSRCTFSCEGALTCCVLLQRSSHRHLARLLHLGQPYSSLLQRASSLLFSPYSSKPVHMDAPV